VNGSATAVPVSVVANKVSELTVKLDLGKQTVSASMNGQTVQSQLKNRIQQVDWIGYCVGGVDAEFSAIELTPDAPKTDAPKADAPKK
jgi:hypothetical protein